MCVPTFREWQDREEIRELHKRKKTDHEGFVTPATPDIPFTSVHFQDSFLKSEIEKDAFDAGTSSDIKDKQKISDCSLKPQSEANNYDQSVAPSIENNPSASSLNMKANMQPENKDELQHEQEDVGGDHKESIKMPNLFANLMTEFGHENRMLQDHWVQVLADSENFELFCPMRLEKILEDAKALEASLLEQKQQLKGRLQILSKTLQLC